MLFEIVTHSHNYSRLLAYQLSSLILYHHGHDLIYSLFHDPKDSATIRCISHFKPLLPINVTMNLIEMPVEFLRNRAIGRNLVAQNTRADWVWYADTDYCFQERCWEMLEDAVKDSSAELVWPHTIRETEWSTGDRLMRVMNDLTVRDVPLSDSVDKRMSRAIGGVQIARASVLKDIGYCPHMTGPSDQWNFRSDVHFRRSLRRVKEIKLWYVTRIRHELKGYGDQDVEVVN